MNYRALSAAAALSAALLLLSSCCGSDEPAESEKAAEAVEEAAAPANPFAAMGEAMKKAAEKKAKGEGAEGAEAKPADMAQAMEGMAQGLAQAMGAMGGDPNAKPVAVVEFDQLLPLLPKAPAGWTADEPKGQTSEMGAFKVTEVSNRYRREGGDLRVKILDTSANPMLTQAFRMGRLVRESSTEGFKRGVSVAGHDAFEEWNKDSKRAKLVTLVGGRFLVEMSGHPFDGTEELKGLVTAMDLAGLSALGKAE